MLYTYFVTFISNLTKNNNPKVVQKKRSWQHCRTMMRDVTTSCVYNAYCNCNDIQIYDTTPLEIIFSVLHVNVHKRQSFKVEKNKTERKMYPDT